jgi:hypothetical protein
MKTNQKKIAANQNALGTLNNGAAKASHMF